MNLLFGSSRLRRGISPVIATVLIIAVTVSAAAVAWVIVSNQLDDDLPTFSYEVQNTVQDNGGAMANNQRIRLYHTDGTYTGKSLRTDVNGMVTIEFIPTGQYMLEYNGRFSAPFTPISTDTINILL